MVPVLIMVPALIITQALIVFVFVISTRLITRSGHQ